VRLLVAFEVVVDGCNERLLGTVLDVRLDLLPEELLVEPASS